MKPIVLFDIGTILVEIDLSRLFLPLSLDPSTFQNWTFYDAFERGRLTEEEFVQEANRASGKSMDFAAFEAWWNSILLGPVPGAPELLRDLGGQAKLYGLSNTSSLHWRYLKKHYDWLSPLEEIYASFHFDARKPEREIYLRFCEKVGAKPSDIVFIDDRHENVEGAKAIGIESYYSSGSVLETRAILEKCGFLLKA